ncbi:MAG: hypothetical protein M3Y41_12185 [Pseudomonadota bacterium]|nr:hypothetical protein [Pseudomonadota bacterium]
MKSVLALVALVLATLALEERARQVASDAQDAYGGAVDQARVATETVSRNVKQQPLVGVLMAGALGYVLAVITPRR